MTDDQARALDEAGRLSRHIADALAKHKVTNTKLLVEDLMCKRDTPSRAETIAYVSSGVYERLSETEFMASPKDQLAAFLRSCGYCDLAICASRGRYSQPDGK